MKGGITTMTLSFTKENKLVEDVYRYLNDSRICSLAGQLSEPDYEALYKALDAVGIKEYAPFFNLAVNRTFFVYNRNEARFYCLILDEDDLKTICERFYIENLQPFYNNSNLRFSRTDARILEKDNPLSMYFGISTTVSKDIEEDDGTVSTVTSVVRRPFYFDISTGTYKSAMAQFNKLLDLYVSISDSKHYTKTKEEQFAGNKAFCESFIEELKKAMQDTSIKTMEYMTAKEYYNTHKGNPKFNSLFGDKSGEK